MAACWHSSVVGRVSTRLRMSCRSAVRLRSSASGAVMKPACIILNQNIRRYSAEYDYFLPSTTEFLSVYFISLWRQGKPSPNYFIMAEGEILPASLPMRLTQHEKSDFKLPRLAMPKSRTEHRQTATHLPPIHNRQEEPQQGGFVLQIEEKLRYVLESVNQGEEEESEQADFEQLIEQNREKIKLQKQKNEAQRAGKAKPENAYQKRVKEYRDASGENKYLQRKKEALAVKLEHRPEVRQQMKQQHRESKAEHKIKVQKHAKSPPRKLPPEQPKNSNNLFDNIHSLLESPHRDRGKSQVSKSNYNSITQLQQKIKLINDKLRQSGRLETKETEYPPENRTVTDWKRAEITHQLKGLRDSSFEKEVQRIGSLQEKNEAVLGEYLQHQQRLAMLAALRRSLPKIAGTN